MYWLKVYKDQSKMNLKTKADYSISLLKFEDAKLNVKDLSEFR